MFYYYNHLFKNISQCSLIPNYTDSVHCDVTPAFYGREIQANYWYKHFVYITTIFPG